MHLLRTLNFKRSHNHRNTPKIAFAQTSISNFLWLSPQAKGTAVQPLSRPFTFNFIPTSYSETPHFSKEIATAPSDIGVRHSSPFYGPELAVTLRPVLWTGDHTSFHNPRFFPRFYTATKLYRMATVTEVRTICSRSLLHSNVPTGNRTRDHCAAMQQQCAV